MSKNNMDMLQGGKSYLVVKIRNGIVARGFILANGSKRGGDVAYEVPQGFVIVENPGASVPVGMKAMNLNLSDADKKKLEKAMKPSKNEKPNDVVLTAKDEQIAESMAALGSDALSFKDAE